MSNNKYPAWHNGKFCQANDLKISVQDFGLLRSYGVYDVITIKNKRALALEQHFDRFVSGCKHYHINLQYTVEDLINVIKKLNRLCTGNIHVWIMATRGIPSSYGIQDIVHAEPQVMLLATPYTPVNDEQPMRLGIARTVRRIPNECIDQRYKNFARQDFTMAQIEVIQERGFDNAVLLDNNEFLTEGPQFNVAIIKDNKIWSPAKNRLPGVTMEMIRTLCQEHNIEFEYSDINETMIDSADDAFATSTAGGIISIVSVDDKQFTETKLQQTIKSLYSQAWEQDQYSTRI